MSRPPGASAVTTIPTWRRTDRRSALTASSAIGRSKGPERPAFRFTDSSNVHSRARRASNANCRSHSRSGEDLHVPADDARSLLHGDQSEATTGILHRFQIESPAVVGNGHL